MSTQKVLIAGKAIEMKRARRAFSLIEILVSILILSLGLLGLGALFPVVIREQRMATDSVVGTIASNNLRSMISADFADGARVRYTQRQGAGGVEVEAAYFGLATLLAGGYPQNATTDFAGAAGFSLGQRNGLWEPRWDWQRSGANQWGKFAGSDFAGRAGGSISFNDQRQQNAAFVAFGNLGENIANWETPFQFNAPAGAGTNGLLPGSTAKRRVVPIESLTIAERFGPASAVGEETPTMVWDMVARRVARGEFNATLGMNRPSIQDDLQVAVFVRRIDQGIRLEPGATLRGALLNTEVGGSSRGVVPIGADSEGRATLDGTDGAGGANYSWPLEAQARNARQNLGDGGVFDFNDDLSRVPAGTSEHEWRQWLENVDVETVAGEAMAQVGQKLIDNLGNVYTVERVEASVAGVVAGAKRIRLNPAPAMNDIRRDNNQNRRIRQFIFTAQVPVTAMVVDVPVKREVVQ